MFVEEKEEDVERRTKEEVREVEAGEKKGEDCV